MAPVLVKPRIDKCKVRDELILAFLLSVNRMNDESSQVEFAKSEVFREEARVVLELSQKKCRKLQSLVIMHCMSHRCCVFQLSKLARMRGSLF